MQRADQRTQKRPSSHRDDHRRQTKGAEPEKQGVRGELALEEPGQTSAQERVQ
jgi:hypothetical protein